MSICDEFNSNCIVRACCSELCDKVGTLVDSYLNHHMDKPWMFHELISNEVCPVCERDMFWFTRYNPPNTNIGVFIKLECDFCLASYRLSTHRDGVGRREPYKILQTYQGTINGKANDLWSIKRIKRHLIANYI